MENETVAQRALRLLSPIPAEQFIVSDFTNGVDKCCGIGHWTRLTSSNPNDYSMDNCDDYGKKEFRHYTRDYLDKNGGMLDDISSINNNSRYMNEELKDKYCQNNPKDRCVALLSDMISAGY